MKYFNLWMLGGFLGCTITACGGGSVGGGGGGSSGSSNGGTCAAGAITDNSQTICVTPGPNKNYVNGLFTSVTICTPGTSTCQTIDNVLVDTGSYGLRLLSSLVTATLPAQISSTSSRIGECTRFADGYSWGPVVTADVRLANETASSVPIQLVGAPSGFPAAPIGCTQDGGMEEDTLENLNANGILGIGVFAQDCGPSCASTASRNQYFACSSSSTPSCVSTTEAVSSQVTNPVALLATDNNGVEIQLPAIGADGAQAVAGALIFGINTRSNNARGSSTVFDTDGFGDISTQYNGTTYSSFIDSGSNALFFPSSITVCNDNADFYCPTSTLAQSAQLIGSSGTTQAISFSIANADSLFKTGNNAFNDLGGGTPGSTLDSDFDLGLPFFFGKNVFFGLNNEATGSGEPYFAY